MTERPNGKLNNLVITIIAGLVITLVATVWAITWGGTDAIACSNREIIYDHNQRITRLETRYEDIDSKLERIENKIDNLDR